MRGSRRRRHRPPNSRARDSSHAHVVRVSICSTSICSTSIPFGVRATLQKEGANNPADVTRSVGTICHTARKTGIIGANTGRAAIWKRPCYLKKM